MTMPMTTLTVTPTGLDITGASAETTSSLDLVPGPLPGTFACRGLGGGETVLQLPRPLGERGSISFWLRSPAAILNGQSTQGGGPTFFELPGLLTCNLWWYSGYAQFNFRFTTDGSPNQALQLPGVPGPQWLHFCLAWEASTGLLQLFVDGTPTRLPGVLIKPWEAGSATELKLPIGSWALADLRLYDEPLTHDQAERMVPPLYRGSLDSLIGAQPRGEWAAENLRGELLYENDLASAEAVGAWRMEGPGVVACDDGWMHMESSEPDAEGPNGHIVHWCDRDFPADFLAEFEIQPESEHGLVILFFCARGSNGEDLFDPGLAERAGVFAHYTLSDIDCYHCSYYANTPNAGKGRGTSNLRKNPGFHLVDQGPIGIPPGSRDVHRIAVLKQGDRIEVAVDGRRVIRWFDPGDRYGGVHGAGKLGFRQMRWMQARYRNLRVFSLKSPAEPG